MPKSKKTQTSSDKLEGTKLFRYLKNDSYDLPATASEIQGKHYTTVGKDLFYRRALEAREAHAERRVKYYRATNPNLSCEEIGYRILDVLESSDDKSDSALTDSPSLALLDAFGDACLEAGLLDSEGRFTDAREILRFLGDF